MSAFRIQLSAKLVSLSVTALSLLWYASTLAFEVHSSRHPKDAVGSAPLSLLFVIVVVPLLMLILVPWLIWIQRAEKRRLRPLDYVPFLAGAAPVLFMVWVVIRAFVSR